jgi:hypothetical protein
VKALEKLRPSINRAIIRHLRGNDFSFGYFPPKSFIEAMAIDPKIIPLLRDRNLPRVVYTDDIGDGLNIFAHMF